MAKYRQVHVEFWQDGFVLDLTPEEKYFYLYLMTNSKTSQCGIYELPKRIIETETGYNRETVDKLIQRFVDYDKIAYSDKTKEIMIKNWISYNFINSPKVINCIKKELNKVKDGGFRYYYVMMAKKLYGIDTLSIDYGEEEEKEIEEEQEEEREGEEKPSIPFSEIVDYLNEKTSSKYRASSKKTKDLIKARWNDKYTLDDFKEVIDNMTSQWMNDSKMNQYLRPSTLFGPKFEEYLNQKPKGSGQYNGQYKEITKYDTLF